MILVDNCECADWLFEGSLLLLPQLSCRFDDVHDLIHLFRYFLIDEFLVDFGDEQIVNGFLIDFAAFSNDQTHVLIHMLG